MRLARGTSRRRDAALFAVTALLAGSSSSTSLVAAVAASELARLRPGVFLYAAPGLSDPNFSEAVVLLVQHGPRGAMGLIINRPTEVDAEEALPGRALRNLRVYQGGPVQREAIIALVRTKRPARDAVRVLEDVFLSGQRKDLEAAARGGRAFEHVRVYSGYSGWGAGQLENEVRLGGWVIGRGEVPAIFSREPGKLWRKVFQLLGRREATLLPSNVMDPTAETRGDV